MLELTDLLVEMEPLESRENVVTPVLLAPPEPLVLLVHLALSALSASRETEESLVPKDLPDPRDPLELEEWLDPKDPVETRERLARLERGDRRVTVVSPVCRVCPDLPVLLETRVLLDLLGLLALRDPLDLSAPLERMEPTAFLDPLDLLDPVDALERLVPLVPQVTPDPLVLLVLQALVSTCLPSPAYPSPRSHLIL